MKHFKQIILGLGALLSVEVFGDSPLTSTAFSEAYLSEPIVMAAGRARGKITRQIMDYLAEKTNPIDVKVAAINKLSWDINGKSNAAQFLEYLRENSVDSAARGYQPVSDSSSVFMQDPLLETLGADELLCYSYMLALDNYFSIDQALAYAEMAVQKNPESYTFCITFFTYINSSKFCYISLIASLLIPRYLRVIEVELWFSIRWGGQVSGECSA